MDLLEYFIRKLFLSLESPIKFDERFKVASVPFFPDFNSLAYELDTFTLRIYIDIILKQNNYTILSRFLAQNSKNVFFFFFCFFNDEKYSLSTFLKSIYRIALGSATRVSCLLKSVGIVL